MAFLFKLETLDGEPPSLPSFTPVLVVEETT